MPLPRTWWTLVLAAGLVLGACGTDDGTGKGTDDRAGSPSKQKSSTVSRRPQPTSSTTPSGTPEPSSTATPSTRSAPRSSGVYFLVDTRAGIRLAREVRDLPGADPAVEAVQAMIAGPQDSDYRSTWNPRTKVLSVRRTGPTITVDLSAAARRAQVGGDAARRMVQQLVYTATEAFGRPGDRVRLMVAGQPAGDLWGAVSWTHPVGRVDPAAVRVLVQIDGPREGASTTSPVKVAGEADAFEANVPWQVIDGNGKVVRQGAATALEGMTFSPYSFTVRLPPGSYTVRVAEDDVSGGEGGTPMADTKRITVE